MSRLLAGLAEAQQRQALCRTRSLYALHEMAALYLIRNLCISHNSFVSYPRYPFARSPYIHLTTQTSRSTSSFVEPLNASIAIIEMPCGHNQTIKNTDNKASSASSRELPLHTDPLPMPCISSYSLFRPAAEHTNSPPNALIALTLISEFDLLGFYSSSVNLIPPSPGKRPGADASCPGLARS